MVILAKPSQNPSSDKLTQGGTTEVDVMAVAQMGLFVEELGSIDEETVYLWPRRS